MRERRCGDGEGKGMGEAGCGFPGGDSRSRRQVIMAMEAGLLR